MAELNIVEKVIALEAVDLFRNLGAEELSRIAAIARETAVAPGRTIIETRQEIDSLYVILDGAVELLRNGQTFHTAQRGEVLGSWALFDSEPMPVDARALTDVKLLRIGRNDFYDLLGDNMQITQAIFSTLVKRFRQLAGN
jgi:CRP-like cAMP-binding protein